MLGGRRKAVIVCDCDGHWNTGRLEQIISAYVLRRVQQTIIVESEPETINADNLASGVSLDVATIVDASLHQIHIFRPTSSLAFAATLIALPSYHISSMPDQEICMLMIDSISAFHWPDHWSTDRAALDAQRRFDAHISLATHVMPMHRILTALNELRQHFGFVTFITNWCLLPPLSPPIPSAQAQVAGNEAPIYAGQHLAPPYPSPFSEANPTLLARRDPNRSLLSITHHISLFVKRDYAPSSVDDTPEEQGPKQKIVGYVRTPVTLDADLLPHTPLDPTAIAIGPISRRPPKVFEGRFEFRLGPTGIIWPPPPEE